MSTARRRLGTMISAIAAVTMLAACASVVDGKPVAPIVQNANLSVVGDPHDSFDTQVKNALSDVLAFWRQAYPSVAHGKAFPPLTGKFYSVDGLEVLQTQQAPTYAAGEQCLRRKPLFVVDNAAYCELDDSVIWDRSASHLLPALSRSYGDAVIPLVFAHEIGHAIQQRLGISDQGLRTIQLESQADCAAGAFLATSLAGRAPHFHLTAAQLDQALDGFLQIRDSTPESPEDISHGNGFDRIAAVGDGIAHGVTYCYSAGYVNRTFTERPYVRDTPDYASGGNEPITDFRTLDGPPGDLNRFWTTAGKLVGTTFQPVKLVEAAHPACGTASPSTEIGYCPDDNTVYYSSDFATKAYYSITGRSIDRSTGAITLVPKQPGDFALGEMLSISWGMAARSQFFHRAVNDRDGLLSAICYSGAYAHDVNLEKMDAVHRFILSPPDMDEATSAILNLVGLDTSFGARGTTGLQRTQSFVTGYVTGLAACT